MSGRHDDDMNDLDPRLERALHDVLGARDPGSASRTLRERVDRVPEQDAAGRERRSRANSALLAVVGLAATLLLVAVLGPMLAARPQGPATSADPSGVIGTPLPTTPPDVPYDYPEMAPYVIDSGGPSPLIDPVLALPVVLVGAAAIVLAVATGRRIRRRRSGSIENRHGRLARLSDRQLGLAWVGVIVAAVVLVAVPQPLTASVNGTGGPFLVTVEGITPSDVFEGQTTAPHPGQVSFQELTITNRGLLPATVGQPQPWSLDGLPIQPGRFATVRLTYEEALAIPEPEPVLLWPGQSTYVRLLYSHLPCEAWGVPASPTSTPWPTFRPDGEAPVVPPDTEVVVRTDLPVAGSVLGLPRTLVVDTGYPFGMVVPTACPPSEPIAVADPSRVPADLAMGNGAGVYTPGDGARNGPDVDHPGGRRAHRDGCRHRVGPAPAPGPGGARGRPGARDGLVDGPAGVALLRPDGPRGAGAGVGRRGGCPDHVRRRQRRRADLRLHAAQRRPGPGHPARCRSRQPANCGSPGSGGPGGRRRRCRRTTLPSSCRCSVDGGATLQVLGQATAGSCARTLAQPHDAWIHLRAIPFTYERLGLRQTTLVPLASSIRVPGDAACLASAAVAPDGREAWFPVRAPVAADPVFLGGIAAWLLAGMAVLVTVAFFRRRDRRRAAVALAAPSFLVAGSHSATWCRSNWSCTAPKRTSAPWTTRTTTRRTASS